MDELSVKYENLNTECGYKLVYKMQGKEEVAYCSYYGKNFKSQEVFHNAFNDRIIFRIYENKLYMEHVLKGTLEVELIDIILI